MGEIVIGISIGGIVYGLTVAALVKIALFAVVTVLSSALQKSKKPRAAAIDALTQRTVTSRDPIASRKIIFGKIRTGGTVSFLGSTENDLYLHEVITLAGHRCKGIKEVYFDEDLAFDENGVIQDKYVKNGIELARIKKHVGESDQVADTDLIAEFSGKWTSNHRGRGICYLYTRLRYNSEVYNSSKNKTAIVEGWDQIYDPRDTNIKWTDNPALCIAKYLNFAMGAEYDTEIDEDTLIASANICDEEVEIPGGVEKRYTLNGVVDTANDPQMNLEEMLSSMAGRCIYAGGKWYILAGAYEAPTLDFDENDLRGNIEIQPRIPRRELFNAVKGVFVAPENNWQPSDFPPVVSEFFKSQDNDEWIYTDIELPFTISDTMAQRLAKILLYSTRKQISVSAPFSLKALQVRGGSTIKKSISRMGWDGKPFLITGWEFASNENEENPELLVRLELRETSSAIYEMGADEYDLIASAPATNLPDPSYVDPPENLEIEEELYSTRDGAGVKAAANLTWSPSSSSWIREYQIEYRKQPDEIWSFAGKTIETKFTVYDIKPGIYDFRIRALTRYGQSDYVYTVKEIYGLLAPPAQITGMTLTGIGGLAIIRWDRHPDLDVRIGGNIVFHHSKEIAGANWNESVSIGRDIPGSDTVAVLPLKPGAYLAKAKDSSNRLSETETIVYADAATILAFANVDQIDEHPTFPGSHDGTIVDAYDNLKIETYPFVAGIYTFASGLDFGTPQRVRLRSILEVISVNEYELFDDRTSNIDTWDSFDGDVAGQGDCQVCVRKTDDDPGGSPQWDDWQKLDSGEFNSRAFQFQARLSSLDPAVNILVSELTVKAEALA